MTRFATEIALTGPWRSPAQLLADQQIDGHLSLHDLGSAAAVGLSGAPIEGPTHLSQFDPLAVAVWGREWFERGCVSAHFRGMVFEGDQVQASMVVDAANLGRIDARKADGTSVAVGSASIGPDYGVSYLDQLRAKQVQPQELFILDQLQVGLSDDGGIVSISMHEDNGPLYPFSLADKLAQITEPHPWYWPETAGDSPWGRAVLPMEMASVLAWKTPYRWPIRQPAFGLFLDLEVRMIQGPLFVDQHYRLDRQVVGLSESRRTESFWTKTAVIDVDHGFVAAELQLHCGFFKASFPGYPADRLAT